MKKSAIAMGIALTLASTSALAQKQDKESAELSRVQAETLMSEAELQTWRPKCKNGCQSGVGF